MSLLSSLVPASHWSEEEHNSENRRAHKNQIGTSRKNHSLPRIAGGIIKDMRLFLKKIPPPPKKMQNENIHLHREQFPLASRFVSQRNRHFEKVSVNAVFFGVFMNHEGETHPKKPPAQIKAQLAQTISGQFVQTLPLFPFKQSENKQKEFSQTFWASYFCLSGWFFGWVAFPLRPKD